MLEPGVGYGTIDLNVKMLKAVPLDRELIAEGHATCTCAILRRPGDSRSVAGDDLTVAS
jgi:acyl-coenzyme A thioesterase PaaI-like protein